jgi:hypothetical protein
VYASGSPKKVTAGTGTAWVKAHASAQMAMLLRGGEIEIGNRVEGIDFRRLSKLRPGPVQLSLESQRSTQVVGRDEIVPVS